MKKSIVIVLSLVLSGYAFAKNDAPTKRKPNQVGSKTWLYSISCNGPKVTYFDMTIEQIVDENDTLLYKDKYTVRAYVKGREKFDDVLAVEVREKLARGEAVTFVVRNLTGDDYAIVKMGATTQNQKDLRTGLADIQTNMGDFIQVKCNLIF